MLSIDLIYSDALFSIISASSNSRMMSIIFGRKLPTGSTEQDAISTIRHIASEWYCPFILGSTISSILASLIYGLAYEINKINQELKMYESQNLNSKFSNPTQCICI